MVIEICFFIMIIVVMIFILFVILYLDDLTDRINKLESANRALWKTINKLIESGTMAVD